MPEDVRERTDTTITIRPDDKAVFADLAEERGHVPQWSMFRIILNHYLESTPATADAQPQAQGEG